MQIFHNPRCTKSRQTLALIQEAGAEVEIVKYLEQTPSKAVLEEVLNKLGVSAFELIRKTEAIYKEEYKGKELSNTEWVDVMVANPKLIERPIVIKGDKAIIGRPPEKVLEFLK